MTEETWYDDCFQVYLSRFKLWISKNKDGENIVTAPTKEECIRITRFYLKGKQEGFPESLSVKSGVVGGKL